MLFILLMPASKETKEENVSLQMEKLRCNSPFMFHHRAIWYIMRTPRRGPLSLFFFVISLFLQNIDPAISGVLLRFFIKNLTIYKKWRYGVCSLPNSFFSWLW